MLRTQATLNLNDSLFSLIKITPHFIDLLINEVYYNLLSIIWLYRPPLDMMGSYDDLFYIELTRKSRVSSKIRMKQTS